MPVLQSFAEENAGKCTISFAVFGQVAAADLDLELEREGGFVLLALPAFFLVCFFPFFPKNNEGGARLPGPLP